MTNSENNIEHIIFDNGVEFWKYSNTNLHRDDDISAIISPNGTEVYHKNGTLFRELGPAIKRSNGAECWNTNISRKIISLHRTDGAAVIRPNGEREYYKK